MSQTQAITIALTARQRFWVDHLRHCARSGQSLKAYATAQGLDIGALYEAKSRLKRMGAWPAPVTRPQFVRVESAVSAALPAALCRVHLRNGTVVEVAGTAVEALLAAAARLP